MNDVEQRASIIMRALDMVRVCGVSDAGIEKIERIIENDNAKMRPVASFMYALKIN